MKIRLIFNCTLLLSLALWGCNPNKPGSNQASTSTVTNTVTQDFETGSKNSYVGAEVNLQGGAWFMDDALLAGTDQDDKNGEQSVRLRNKGILRMQFDVDGASAVTLRHGIYGRDKTSGWVLNMSVDGGRTFTQVGANIVASKSNLQTITFLVNHNGPIRFEVKKTSGGSNRINIDDFTIYPYGAQAPASTKADTSANPSGEPAADDNTHLLLGNPSSATADIKNADNYLLTKPYYVLSYNRSRGCPNWVSWYVGDEWLGRTKRTNDFRPDDSLPKGWYRVQNTSYIGSGFERGHNCPSADRSNTTKANSATFLMTNMIPQAPANNQHTWGNLENYERYLVNQGNEVYVIMGSYGKGGYGTKGYYTTIDSGRITVPAFIWKVVVVLPNGNNDLKRVDAQTRVIAVITPNNNGISSNWAKYICTVRDIEKATGYDLLSKLPVDVQNIIENRKDSGITADDGYISRL
jgi:endonuclease G, mitochondrial